MTNQIDTTASINSIRLIEQSTAGSTPAAGFANIFATNGGLYLIDSAGASTGPFGASTLLSTASVNSIGFIATRTTSQTIPTTTWTSASLNSISRDTHGFAGADSTIFTIPTGLGGIYAISGGINIEANGAGTFRGIRLDINDIQYAFSSACPNPTVNGLNIATIASLSDGDTIALKMYQDAGGNLDSRQGSASNTPVLAIQKLDIGEVGGETAGAKAHHNVVQSIPNATWTTASLNTTIFDTDNMHSTTASVSGRLTINTAGKYIVNFVSLFAPNNTGARYFRLQLNNSTTITQTAASNSLLIASYGRAATIYNFQAGDYIEGQVYQDSGGALNLLSLDAGSWAPVLEAIRVGNVGGGDPILFTEQSSLPSTPTSGKYKVFASANGLYGIDDTGASIGPFGTGGASVLLSNASDINSVRMIEQSTAGSTPGAGFGNLFATNGGVYWLDSAGASTGPFGASTLLSTASVNSIGARAINTVNLSTSSTSSKDITFNTEVYDTHGFFTPGGSRFTVPTGLGGKYLIGGAWSWEGNATGRRLVDLWLNKGSGTPLIIGLVDIDGQGTNVLRDDINVVYDLNEGDYVTMRALQNSGGALNFESIGSGTPAMWIQKLDIGEVGGETAGAKVYNTTDLTASSGALKKITFDTGLFDTDNIHSTTASVSSRLTAQTAGKYAIYGNIRWSLSDASSYRLILVKKNDSTVITENRVHTADGTPTSQNIFTIDDLNVGDYIELEAFHTTGADQTISSLASYVPVFGMHRIGNVGGGDPITLAEQTSAPATPGAGKLKVYASANGLNYINDAGEVGRVGTEIRDVIYNGTLSGASKFEITNISQDYDHLEILFRGRGDVSADGDTAYIYFNNDTTNTNYRYLVTQGTAASTLSSSGDIPFIGSVPAATAGSSNNFSVHQIKIPFYRDTNMRTMATFLTHQRQTETTQQMWQGFVEWENTAAITRIEIRTDNDPTDRFIANSRLVLYGIRTAGS